MGRGVPFLAMATLCGVVAGGKYRCCRRRRRRRATGEVLILGSDRSTSGWAGPLPGLNPWDAGTVVLYGFGGLAQRLVKSVYT